MSNDDAMDIQSTENDGSGVLSSPFKGAPLIWAVGALASLVPLLLVLLARPTGDAENAWLSFLGNFHPIAVHFPIAFVFIIPIIEIAARSFRIEALKASTPFLWGFAFLGGILAPTLGWSLAATGASGPLVSEHMWSGVFVAPLCFLCMLLSQLSVGGGGFQRSIYVTASLVAIGVVSFTGYRGGQITHGKNHLTASLPPPFDEWISTDEHDTKMAATPDDGYYAFVVAPILESRCVSCHGPNKQKGRLRLDTFTEIMKGGTSGAVVIAGQTSSELIRRVTLPMSHDEFMPTGKSPLSPEQIDALSEWIAAGAPEMGSPPEKFLTMALATNVDEQSIDAGHFKLDPAKVAKEREEMAVFVQQYQQRFPGLIAYEARSSANLNLNALAMRHSFDDNTLRELEPVLERIVVAELSGTAVTDTIAPIIAKMPKLKQLTLAHTEITDVFLEQLSEQENLEVLNLYGTNVTLEGLSKVTDIPSLKRVYIAETPAIAALNSEDKSKNPEDRVALLSAGVQWIGQ